MSLGGDSSLYKYYASPNFTPKEGGNNRKSKNRKQHLIKCKRILWALIIHILQTCKYLSSDVGKYVYQYHSYIRLTLQTTDGLAVPTPRQRCVLYILSANVGILATEQGFSYPPGERL